MGEKIEKLRDTERQTVRQKVGQVLQFNICCSIALINNKTGVII